MLDAMRRMWPGWSMELRSTDDPCAYECYDTFNGYTIFAIDRKLKTLIVGKPKTYINPPKK